MVYISLFIVSPLTFPNVSPEALTLIVPVWISFLWIFTPLCLTSWYTICCFCFLHLFIWVLSYRYWKWKLQGRFECWSWWYSSWWRWRSGLGGRLMKRTVRWGLILQSCFCKIMCMLIPLILVHHSSIPGSQNINFEGMNLYSTNGSSYITDISAIMLVFSFISGGLNGGKLHYNFFFFLYQNFNLVLLGK